VALATGLVLSCALFQPVQAQTVMATWLTQTQTAGATPQDPPQAPQAAPLGVGVTASSLTRVGVDYIAAADSFNADNWPLGGFNVGKRFEWSVATTGPYAFQGLTLTLRRSGTGPDLVRLDVRVDGGAWTTVDSWTLPNANAQTRTITRAQWEAVFGSARANSAIGFRLHAWSASNALGTLRITNSPPSGPPVSGRGIVLSGTPLAVVNVTKSVFLVPPASAACSNLGFVPTAALWNTNAALPGSCLEYRITATNTGLGAAAPVNLVDALGANLFQAFAGFGGFAQLGSCSVGAVCTVTARSTSLAAGASGGFRVRVQLP
jgi:uncharacterized repeat protein (TIGR01451 family)